MADTKYDRVKASDLGHLLSKILGREVFLTEVEEDNGMYFGFYSVESLNYYQKGFNSMDFVVIKSYKGSVSPKWGYSLVTHQDTEFNKVHYDMPKYYMTFPVFIRVFCHEFINLKIKELLIGSDNNIQTQAKT